MKQSESNRNHKSSNKPETHEPKFRGTFVPAEIFFLLRDGKLTSTEFALLQIIDSLVDAEGDGCWASNDYLANYVRCKVRHVQKMIAKLKEMELIKQVGWKKIGDKSFRILETKWSRLNASTDVINDRGGVSLMTPREDSSTKSLSSSEMRRPAGGRKPHTSLKASKQYSEDVRVGATLLRDALRKANKQVAGRSDARWFEPLRLLEEVDKQKDWLSYLRRYCKTLPRLKKLEEEGFKLPICNNAEQFRNLYGRWIVPVLDKMSEEDIEDRNSTKSRFSIYNEETW